MSISPELARVLKEMGMKLDPTQTTKKESESYSREFGVLKNLFKISMNDAIFVNATLYLDEILKSFEEYRKTDLCMVKDIQLECISNIVSIFGMIICFIDNDNLGENEKNITVNEIKNLICNLASVKVISEIDKKYHPNSEEEFKKLLDKYSHQILIKSYMEAVING